MIVLATCCSACDSVTEGQDPADPNPPVLVKLLAQDESPGGRGLATDLLDIKSVACSLTEPCAANEQYEDPTLASGVYLPTCIIPDGATSGVCTNRLSPTVTPVAVGKPDKLGGTQFRLVFSKLLSPDIEDVAADQTFSLKDPSIVALLGADGKEVPSVKYWDPTGAPNSSANLFNDPFGPALVVKPMAQLIPLTAYVVALKPSSFVDKLGQSVQRDINGPVSSAYPFTAEAFYATGDSLSASSFLIMPDDVITLPLSSPPETAKPRVTMTFNGNVLDPAHYEVAFDQGSDSTKCAANTQKINVFSVSAPGTWADWPVGNYTLSVELASATNPAAHLSTDAFGKTLYTNIAFTVSTTARAPDAGVDNQTPSNFVFPESCVSPDGGAPLDGGMHD